MAEMDMLRECIGMFRRLLVVVLPSKDIPTISDRNVYSLVVQLKITPRQLQGLYKTFQELRSFDSVIANTTTEECSTDSVLRLVRRRRQWVEKLLRNLLELGGYRGVITWQGFLYVMLSFCTLSKLELCQVMFFIIARDMKSWTVDYVTTMQLHEFYEDYAECPIKSFNTGSIKFTSLARAKYRMTDFIELCYRFSQLVNPILYLQRCVQQTLPSLRFWKDFDRVKLRNRQITLDYFRYMKPISISELSQGLGTYSEAVRAPTQEEMLMLDFDGDAWDPRSQIRRRPKLVDTDLPLPLPGPGPPGWIPPRKNATRRVKQLPEWIEETVANNCDPIKGTALGTAAIPEPIPAWAAPFDKHMMVDEAKSVIVGTHRVLAAGMRRMIEIPPPKKNLEFEKLAARSQALEFVRTSRERKMTHKALLGEAGLMSQGELIKRPQKENYKLPQRQQDIHNPGGRQGPAQATPGAPEMPTKVKA